MLVLCLTVFSASAYENESFYKGSEGTTINVFNWGEYISDTYEDGLVDVNAEFEKLTGIKVEYTTFDSNEVMYSKVKSGTVPYDIVIPSDYMIARLKQENMLLPLNFDNIPNYKFVQETFKNTAYDPENKYSVPYLWGTVGILYNTTKVDDPVTSWDILWNEKYAEKIWQYDSVRDAMIALGYQINTADLAKVPSTYVELTSEEDVENMEKMLDKFNEDDDVNAVYHNWDN